AHVEPIFLLYDGPLEGRGGSPLLDVELEGVRNRLWRVEGEAPVELASAQLLIADGHHRYETALAYHEEDGTEESAWLLAVIVPTDQEGLTIFPTHRVVQGVDGISGTPIDRPADVLPGLVLYRKGQFELLESDGL